MSLSTLRKRILLDASLDEVWSFFSNPYNLKTITPVELGFEIVGQPPSVVFDGLHIHYRVRPLFGIAVTWVSEITHVIERKQFADIQIVGPYRYWHHLHQFQQTSDGVLVEDVIHYALPWLPFSNVVRKVWVEPKLENIFYYRKQSISQLFPVLEKFELGRKRILWKEF